MIKRRLIFWEIGSFIWIALAGSALHFAFELSEFWQPLALFSSVNESTWEHLKMYFWPGLIYALVQYTYTKDIANNYWVAKLVSLLATPLGIIISYYGYLSITLPLYGTGFFEMDLMTMVIGLTCSAILAYKIMLRPKISSVPKLYVVSAYLTLTAMYSTFTYYPPKIFLFENFFGYEYKGEYGILENYEPYRVFKKDPVD